MCAVLAVFLDYKASCRDSNHFLAHPLFKALFFSIGVLYTILIGYSRMLLGAHSLDQVLFGWFLGAWLAAALHHIFRRPIIKHANKILSGEPFNLQHVLLKFTTLLSLVYMVAIMVFRFLDPTIKNIWEVQIS